jgi:hypothetical protein
MRFILVLLAAAAPASAMMWGLGVSGGFGMPAGGYSEFVGASAVADGRAIICVTPNLGVTAGAGYRVKHNPKDFEGSDVAAYDVLPILVGVNYRFDYLPIMPYAGGGIVAAICKSTVPTEAEPGSEELKATRLGAYGEGGMEYYLAENFGLDLRGRFVATFGGDSATYRETTVASDNYMAFDALVGVFIYP